MSRYLITSDLHLTSKPEDAYRFDLFPWLLEESHRLRIHVLFILGDLTDAKDRHPASLVQKVVESIQLVTSQGLKVVILKGNHDYTDPTVPFFGFLGELDNVRYIHEPTLLDTEWCGAVRGIACIPHSHKPIDWKAIVRKYKHVDYMFLHHTFGGSLASNGQKMQGDAITPLDKVEGFVISGDIHVPQKIGSVRYVGSPYTIRFNDAFTPRVLYEGLQVGPEDLHFPCLVRQKVTIHAVSELDEKSIREGDQVKVKVTIPRSSVRDIPELRRQIREKADLIGFILCGVEFEVEAEQEPVKEDETMQVLSPDEIVTTYGRREGLTESRIQVGKSLVMSE